MFAFFFVPKNSFFLPSNDLEKLAFAILLSGREEDIWI